MINIGTLTLTKLIEKKIERGVLDSLKVASIVDVDAFVEQATEIARKSKKNSKPSVEARQEAHVLWGRFENYLKAVLKASDNPLTRLDSTANEEQLTEVPVT